MTARDQKRGPRRFTPDLHQLASATECTGILPAQPAEAIPEEDEIIRKQKEQGSAP